MGSPTIIALFARASEGTASHVGIWEASSKMTMSNRLGSGGRYCDTVEGLIKRQGATTFNSSGKSVKSKRRLKPRILPFTWRLKAISSSASGPSVCDEGRRAMRSWRMRVRVS